MAVLETKTQSDQLLLCQNSSAFTWGYDGDTDEKKCKEIILRIYS